VARITREELQAISGDLPWVAQLHLVVEELGEGTARIRLPASADHSRPGGTISGPAMMTLADYGFYVALLGAIGPVALAVTTNLSINFLRKPPLLDLIGEARVIKLGKRLAYGEVLLFSLGHSDDPVAHATLTYSIPPDRPPLD